MDADYYFAGGVQLAEGNGFNEPFLWNFLDPANTIPHPSHGYWMPLASIISAGGILVAGSQSWLSGRLGFFIIAAIIPVITAKLAYSFSKKIKLSFLSGLLAIFSGFYAAYMQVTDTFSLYMLLGGLFFLIAHSDSNRESVLLGILSGLFHLARADGVFWLILSLMIICFNRIKSRSRSIEWIFSTLLCLLGYILIMGPWFVRNYQVFGSYLGPQAANMLWLTHYDQIFSFPPVIEYAAWIDQGIKAIMDQRFAALKVNLVNTFVVQGTIILIPFIIIAGWKLRNDKRIGILVGGWIGIMLLMSCIFPFAGMRGGYFHAGAAIQPMLWSLAPVGLVETIRYIGGLRSWNTRNAERNFSIGLILFVILITGYVTIGKIFDFNNQEIIWGGYGKQYQSFGEYISSSDLGDPTVIVRNPPGFFLATGLTAIAIPDGDEKTLLRVVDEFDADFLILEPSGFPQSLKKIYNGSPDDKSYKLVDEMNGARLFLIDQNE
ncbi:hypothetical protein ACFLTX_01175 [Chloroflexota bacterium]